MENTPEYKCFKNPKAVIAHNGFEFNAHDVCLNPEILVITQGRKHHLTISVAESPKGWCAGYDYDDARNGGGAGGCSGAAFGEYRTKYPTREEAIEGKLKVLHKFFHGRFDAEIKAYLTPKPLTLF